MSVPMSPTDARVYVGALNPEALDIDVEPNASLPDLTVVTSADIVPYYQGTPLQPWVVDTMANQTPTTLKLLHLWRAGETSMSRLGQHTLLVRLYIGPLMRRCIPKRLYVLPIE